MILGHVRDRFPRVVVSLEGIDGPVDIEFVVDTGFDGDITLPPPLLSRFDEPVVSYVRVVMADGSVRRVPAYEIQIDWDGERRTIEAVRLEGRPLLGAVLLEGCNLQAEMVEGGEVYIEPI